MKDTPVFSILSPVYNVENFLTASIESVLSQTFADWELILVDDGATDNSGKICEAYAAKFPGKIKVFHNTNHGQLYSRNFAVSKARGKYYVFLDSDDKLVSNALEIIYKNFQCYDCDCVIYGMALVSPDGEIGTICKDKEDYVIDKRLFYRHIFLDASYNALWRKAIKSSLLPFKDYSSFYHIRYGEDLLQSLEILHNCQSVLFIPNVLYYYVQNSDSMIHTRKQKPLQLSFEVMDKILEFLNQEKIFTLQDMQDYHDYCIKLFEYKLKQISRHPAPLCEKVKLFKSVKQQKYYTNFLASNRYKQPISLLYCQFQLGLYRLLVLEVNFYDALKKLFKAVRRSVYGTCKRTN